MENVEKLRKEEKRAEKKLDKLRKEVYRDLHYLRGSDEKDIDKLIAALEADV